MNHWLELAKRLHRHGTEVILVGGPAEAGRLLLLRQALQQSLGYQPRSIAGSDDFQSTLERLAHEVDLVIATDSGTAHLAALVRPVVSLFGGSPWRRFAPLGPCNAVVTRQLPCSPCPQFDRGIMNTCSTRECLVNLSPAQVEACLDFYLAGKVGVRPRLVSGVWLARAPWEFHPYRSSARHVSLGEPAALAAG